MQPGVTPLCHAAAYRVLRKLIAQAGVYKRRYEDAVRGAAVVVGQGATAGGEDRARR